ncbi:hypothetical protein AB6A40_006391 [Gnathostoma spinigerum]|uniref:Major facilitator superfamily (MFS) profile domain-containing protein n=1 Tax=Gnathostoma spinigerum TaxID=75299 RepID=A0ABD6ESM6_9BILA
MGTTSTENNGNSDMKQKSGEAEMSPSSKSKTDSSYNTTSSKSKSDREVPEKNNLNDFFGLGKYTAYVCLSYEIMLLAITFNLIFMTYGGAMTKVVGCGTERFENVNNFSQADFDKERCRLYNKLSESPGCTPMVEYEFYSVSTEFGIYCSEKARIKTSTSIQMAGLMAGAMLFGIISDKVGRKMALVIGFAGMSLLSILASFAWGILTFTAGRTLAMIFCGGVHCVSYCFMMESLPKKHRLWIITVVNISPNYILYATFAYLSHDWRTLSRVGGAIGICACISLLFDQETTVWMLNKEYYDSAQKSMETISRWDGKNTPERIGEIKRVIGKERDRVEKKKAEAGGARKKYYIYHLFTSWKLAVYAIFFAYSL